MQNEPADKGGGMPPPTWPTEATGFIPHGFVPKVQILDPMPRILIAAAAYDSMRYLVRLCPKEVGWLGCVTELKSNLFRIDEVFLHEQVVSDVETVIDGDTLALFAHEMFKRGDEGDRILANLRFWGHSHVFFETVPSPKDNQTMLMIQESGGPWFIRGIFNKRGSASFSFYNFAKSYVVHDVPWQLEEREDLELMERVAAEMREKVSEKGIFGRKPVEVNHSAQKGAQSG